MNFLKDMIIFPFLSYLSYKWQATIRVPTCIGSGLSLLQRSVALVHLVQNGHPFGGLIGLGTSPPSTILCLFLATSGSGIGMADSSAVVYGCSGR